MICIKQGDADTLTEEIDGLTSLSGYSAKLYIYDTAGAEIDTLTGTVNATALTVTYQLVNEDTKNYPLGKHKYESKIFDASDHVYTTSAGVFRVSEPIESDPS